MVAKIKRFEELDVWQVARSVVNAVYSVSSDRAFSRDYVLRDQIRRAAISIPSNIAEGFSRHSNKEFIRFLFIAKASAAEVQSQLYTALDQEYISQEEFDGIYGQVDIAARQISRFITYLKEAG